MANTGSILLAIDTRHAAEQKDGEIHVPSHSSYDKVTNKSL
jgi:hypothetical protein